MAEGLIMLCVLGIVISLILFVLIVRFLWCVPSSLQRISFYLTLLYRSIENDKNDDDDDF